MLKISTVRLNEALWNGLLFTPKDGITEGKIFVAYDGDLGVFQVYASDNFITIEDNTPVENSDLDSFSFQISITEAKRVEGWLRNVVDEFVVMFVEDDNFTLAGEINPSSGVDSEIRVSYTYPNDVWADLLDIFEHANRMDAEPVAWVAWALNLDRLKQLGRLKGTGHNLIDFLSLSYGVDHVWGMKIGNNISGVLLPMNRSRLRERGCVLWSDGV